jgi:hypothetical protein
MWPKSYRDYKVDQSLIKYEVEPSHGIIGCEMHDLNGWGNSLHIHKKSKRKGLFRSLFSPSNNQEEPLL